MTQPRLETLLDTALRGLPPKPGDDAKPADKKRYSELVSQGVAQAFADELRHRGLKGTRPAPPGELGGSGAERRIAGGIGAKKVDVSWATEESGLLLGVSVKTVNFRDGTTNNFQKNITNRRGDMLVESTTLHRRFPFAVLCGFMFLDKDAGGDDTARRKSTFHNTHRKFALFSGRDDPSDREEQFEEFYIVLLDATPFAATARAYAVGAPDKEIGFGEVFDDIVERVALRNPDFYDYKDGKLRRAP